MTMNKKLTLLIMGLVLLVTSLPLSSMMILEIVHEQKMKRTYTITNVNEGYPATPATYSFDEEIIEIEERSTNNESYIDPWQFKIDARDVTFKVNGKTLHTLHRVPVRVEEEGLNRYYGEFAYLTLEDKQAKQTSFVLLLKTTRSAERELPNGDMIGYVPPENLTYTLYAWDEKGNKTSESFTFTNRNALQTELMNKGNVTPYSIGYYTNAWHTYPSLFFPFLFPFGTLFMGFGLFVWALLKKKKTSF